MKKKYEQYYNEMADLVKTSDLVAGGVAALAAYNKILPVKYDQPGVAAAKQVVFSSAGRMLGNQVDMEPMESKLPVREKYVYTGVVASAMAVMQEENMAGIWQDAMKAIACSWVADYGMELMAIPDNKLL